MSKEKILILANNDVGLYKFRKELIQELLCPGSIVDGRSGNGAEVYIALLDGEFVQPLEQYRKIIRESSGADMGSKV